MEKNKYSYNAEQMKDIALEENRKLKKQLARQTQNFEVLKSVYYNNKMDLLQLNDVVVGCTGCLYSMLFLENEIVTNLAENSKLKAHILKNKNYILEHNDLFVDDSLDKKNTIVMYPITHPEHLESSSVRVQNIILIYPTEMFTDEILELIKSFMTVTEVLINMVLTRDMMFSLAEKDTLTGAYNREMWIRKLKEMKKSKESQFILSIDIDSFKKINDTHGYDKGDELLKFLAYWLNNTFEEKAGIFRLGSNEFAVAGSYDKKNEKAALELLKSLPKKYTASVKKALNIDSTITIGAISMDKFPKKDIQATLFDLVDEAKNSDKNEIAYKKVK